MVGSQGLKAIGDRGHIEAGEATHARKPDVTSASWSLQAPPHCRPAHVPSIWFSSHHSSLPHPWEAQGYLVIYMGEEVVALILLDF